MSTSQKLKIKVPLLVYISQYIKIKRHITERRAYNEQDKKNIQSKYKLKWTCCQKQNKNPWAYDWLKKNTTKCFQLFTDTCCYGCSKISHVFLNPLYGDVYISANFYIEFLHLTPDLYCNAKKSVSLFLRWLESNFDCFLYINW